MENWTLQRVEKELLFAPQNQERLAKILPKNLTPDRFALMAMEYCRDSKEIMSAIQQDGGASFLSAVIQAGEVGLSLNRALGLAALTPRKGKVVFSPMYRGLIHLARASGQVLDAWADVVYEGDEFDLVRGTEPKLVHKPDYKADRSDRAIIGAYACARLRDTPDVKFEFVTLAKIEKCREAADSWRSPSGKEWSPWTKNFPEMCKKTAVRQLCNLLQLDGDAWEKAIQADNDEYDWKAKTVGKTLPLPGTAQETPKQAQGTARGPLMDSWPPQAPETVPAAVYRGLEEARAGKLAKEPPSRFVASLQNSKAEFDQAASLAIDRQVADNHGVDRDLQEKEHKSYEELKTLVGQMCLAMSAGDLKAAADLLEFLSGFEGDNGFRKGFRSLKGLKVSEKWLFVTYGKVKDAYEKWLAERVIETPSAEQPPSDPAPATADARDGPDVGDGPFGELPF